MNRNISQEKEEIVEGILNKIGPSIEPCDTPDVIV